MSSGKPDVERLYTAAELYRSLNWSVIPTNGKVAAVVWQAFQQRRATSDQITAWFATGLYTALAIITGNISQLVVLDFDDLALYERFAKEFPFFSATLIVRTRRGMHVYLRTASGSLLQSMKIPGLDVQYNGRYVIAPPSIVDGFTYAALKFQMPHLLTSHQEKALMAYLKRLHTPLQAAPAPVPAVEPTLPACDFDRFTLDELTGIYRQKAFHNGRNNSLFQTSLLARDSGYTFDQTLAALVDVHIHQPAAGKHESESSRKREAICTIRSAYKRPPRQGRAAQKENGLLPNVIREALLQHKAACVIRLLEGLRSKGIDTGQTFTIKEAVTLLKGTVGRDSIYNALHFMVEGAALLDQKNPSPALTPMPEKKGLKTISKMHEIGEKKSGKIQKGRKPTLYIMPSNRVLAERLGVRYRAFSDALPPESLKSARQVRQDLHTTYLQRRPGQYPMQFFANRLSVTRRTIQNYHHSTPHIHREAVFTQQQIYWYNLEKIIPDELPHGGFFLTDEQGNRYPAKVAVARRLMGKKKQQIMLNRQRPNLYWLGEGKPAALFALQLVQLQTAAPRHVEQTAQRWLQPVQNTYLTPSNQGTQPPLPQAESAVPPVPTATVTAKTKPPRPKSIPSGKRRLKDAAQEQLANRLHQAVQHARPERAGEFTLASARRLVARYGIAQVHKALQTLLRRKNLYNPAGFITLILASNARHLTRSG